MGLTIIVDRIVVVTVGNKITSWHLKKAKRGIEKGDLQPVVVLDQNGNHEYHAWDPEDPPYDGLVWDHTQYGGPAVFLRSPDGGVYSESLDLDLDDDDIELTPTDRTARLMNSSIIDQLKTAVGELEDDTANKVQTYLLMNLGIGAAVLIILVLEFF